MSIVTFIKSRKEVKSFVHWCLIPTGKARPRLWVSVFLNPFLHKRGKGANIARFVRLDVVPFQPFCIGKNSTIEDFAAINNGVGPVRIGDNSLVGIGNVIIGPTCIGSNVILAQNVILSGLNHEFRDVTVPIRNQPVNTKPIVVEDDCWIGANAVITAGVVIGRHSVVAAGAVVTKDVPPFSIVAGNPAKVIKYYNTQSGTWERYRDSSEL